MNTTVREIAKGHEHNHLADIAKRLDVDGHAGLADDYRGRAERAMKVYAHLRDLDGLSGGTGLDAERGLAVLEELVSFGWTPPEYLPTENN